MVRRTSSIRCRAPPRSWSVPIPFAACQISSIFSFALLMLLKNGCFVMRNRKDVRFMGQTLNEPLRLPPPLFRFSLLGFAAPSSGQQLARALILTSGTFVTYLPEYIKQAKTFCRFEFFCFAFRHVFCFFRNTKHLMFA